MFNKYCAPSFVLSLLFMNYMVQCFKFQSNPLKVMSQIVLKIVPNVFSLTPYMAFPQYMPTNKNNKQREPHRHRQQLGGYQREGDAGE